MLILTTGAHTIGFMVTNDTYSLRMHFCFYISRLMLILILYKLIIFHLNQNLMYLSISTDKVSNHMITSHRLGIDITTNYTW